MERLYKKTLIAIEAFIGLFSIVYAIGIGASQVTAKVGYHSSIFDILVSPKFVGIYSIVIVISGIGILTGLITKRDGLTAASLFLGACIRIFQIISIWLIYGFFRPNWITPAIVCVTCVILWIGRRAVLKHR